MGTEDAFSISWDLEVEFERTSSQSSFIETVSFVIGLIFKEDVSFSFHKGVKELLEEMLDGKSLSWFSVWVKFFDNFFHGLFSDFVKGLLVHFLNLLHIFVWVRHNFNLIPIFLVMFRGVVSRDKLKESVYDLRIKDEGLDVIFGEEKIKRDMKSTGGFHDDNWVLERVKGVKEGFKAFKGHREVTRSNGLSGVIENAEMKTIFRDVDTYIVLHFATSDLRFLKSLTPSSRVAGAFLAQPTYWVLRDRGTYSFGGSKAYEKWSPCPSLFCKLQPYNITQRVLSKT